ncbi:hypothetical protein CDQ83_06695 [Clostridium thermosuccinogenes]|nr:hypothetical protein CDQ83_06695 [Pseudoclostridium thermosuccinogenes]
MTVSTLHNKIYITCRKLHLNEKCEYNRIRSHIIIDIWLDCVKIENCRCDEEKSKLLMSFTESSGKLKRSKE